MTISEEYYRDCVLVTSSWPHEQETLCQRSATGLAQEAARLSTLLCTSEPVEQGQLLEQMGAIFWHYTLLLHTLDLRLQDVMAANIRWWCAHCSEQHPIQQLARRYPGIPGIETRPDVRPRLVPRTTSPRHEPRR